MAQDNKIAVKKKYNFALDPSSTNLMADVAKRLGSEGLPNRDVVAKIMETFKKNKVSTTGKKLVMVQITIEPQTKKFEVHTHVAEQTSVLIRRELGIEKGAATTGHGAAIAELTLQQLDNVAMLKAPDFGLCELGETLSPRRLHQARMMVCGTAKSQGILCPMCKSKKSSSHSDTASTAPNTGDNNATTN